jgi:alanyl-tRNA synthetase
MSTPVISVADIRKTFLDFFASKGHTVVASSPLVPGNDPTLMFTNSGMVQFKDVFLGEDKRSYVRAASVQACLRAGGKHNDLENVGYTARHHTFFEMLGNWSFGDYFKRDSLKWAFELLTQVYKLPAEKLWATVYIEDDEAYDIWTKEIGLPPERVVRIGDNKGGRYMSDNFWMMADTGPCGPCSEIFYDHGPEIAGGPPGSPEQDGDRYIEIWNNVFMQFDMQPDGSVKNLPAPCVDTGMGLERLAAILQHVHSNYEIDIFDALIKAAARETGCADLQNKSLRVIADHIRATAFLVSDGVVPSNEGRGYVQRRIVRRAIRHGYKLGQKTPFFHKLMPDLVKLMGEAYPSLASQEKRITDILKAEEERFYETLEVGMQILDAALEGGAKVLPGEVAFKLHDTYGFPLDLSADVCRERNLSVDEAGFTAAMERQKAQARAAGKFKMDRALEYSGAGNHFVGYDDLQVAVCRWRTCFRTQSRSKRCGGFGHHTFLRRVWRSSG